MSPVVLQEIVSLQQELDQSAAKVAENQNLVNTIEAVIDYRTSKRQAEQLEQQIAALTQQIGQVNKSTLWHADLGGMRFVHSSICLGWEVTAAAAFLLAWSRLLHVHLEKPIYRVM
jgi:site-specific recombinase